MRISRQKLPFQNQLLFQRCVPIYSCDMVWYKVQINVDIPGRVGGKMRVQGSSEHVQQKENNAQ
jgi:hypothetical protein